MQGIGLTAAIDVVAVVDDGLLLFVMLQLLLVQQTLAALLRLWLLLRAGRVKCRLIAERIVCVCVGRIGAPLLSNLWHRLRRGAAGQAHLTANARRQFHCTASSGCATGTAGTTAALLSAADPNAYARQLTNAHARAHAAAAAVQRVVAVVVLVVPRRRLATAAIPGAVARRRMPAAGHIQAVGSMPAHAARGLANSSQWAARRGAIRNVAIGPSRLCCFRLGVRFAGVVAAAACGIVVATATATATHGAGTAACAAKAFVALVKAEAKVVGELTQT